MLLLDELQNRISYLQGRALIPRQLPFQQLPGCVGPKQPSRSRVVFYRISEFTREDFIE